MLPRRVSELVDDPVHAGLLEGASAVGHAEQGGIVRVAVWTDRDGRVRRARFRAAGCPVLVAYAEVACAIAESQRLGHAPTAPDIRAAVLGVHPLHHARADAVALAFTRALQHLCPPLTVQERA